MPSLVPTNPVMQRVRITLKNYRCFADTDPVSFVIEPGVTALVGPNNAGKSTLLKVLYELRDVFGLIASIETLQRMAKGATYELNPVGVEDPIELFHNQNKRPLSLEFEFPDHDKPEVSAIVLAVDYDSTRLRGEVFVSPPRTRAIGKGPGAYQQGFQLESGNSVLVNLELVASFFSILQRALYIGPYRNAISEAGGAYYDLAIGTNFVSRWNAWKTGGDRRQNEAAQQVEADIARIFGYSRIEINAAATNAAQTLQVIIDGKPFRLRELGAGLAQFIVVFGNVVMTRPPLLPIDEPELNLHPALQSDLLLSLTSYVANGVLFATHSIGLARSTADRIYSFRRDNERSIVRQFEQTHDLAEFLGEMSFSSFKELGHDTVLLAEGVEDVKVAQQFLRLYKREHEVVVLPMGGSQLIRGGREVELAELARLTSNVAVLIDSERSSEGVHLDAPRSAFVEDCRKLGFVVHATKHRAIENYFTDAAVKGAMGSEFNSLAPYDLLKAATKPWAKSSNWRIARMMTRAELDATDLGQFFDSLPRRHAIRAP